MRSSHKESLEYTPLAFGRHFPRETPRQVVKPQPLRGPHVGFRDTVEIRTVTIGRKG